MSPLAVVFDAYGTLFDVMGTVREAAAPLGDRAIAFGDLWRTKQLQYTWLRSLQRRYVSFDRVTADALDFALDAFRITDPGIGERLRSACDQPARYPDALLALQRLSSLGIPCWILSNGTERMLSAAVSANGLDSLIAGILTVDSVGVYKPDPRVYKLAEDALAAPAARSVFVSSNSWDAYAAADYGFRAVWCNRANQVPERLPGELACEIASLDALPECMDLERRSPGGALALP